MKQSTLEWCKFSPFKICRMDSCMATTNYVDYQISRVWREIQRLLPERNGKERCKNKCMGFLNASGVGDLHLIE